MLGSPSGNHVDGLPLDCHTETIAKLARLGAAKNDELVTKFGRINNVLIDEADEDAKKTFVKRRLKINTNVVKYRKRNATTRLMIYQKFWKFRKYEIFREQIEKYENLKFSKGK